MRKSTQILSANPSGLIRAALTVAAISCLAACGGGGGGGSGDVTADGNNPPPLKPVSHTYAQGTIEGFGSIRVNGVRYDESKATIRNDDGSNIAKENLKLGMVVDIIAEPAQTNSAGIKVATASQVHYRSELEGPLTAVFGNQLTVFGQQVLLNETTVFEDGRAASLVIGKILELYGQRRADGTILASRIEIENDADDLFKLRGPVTALDVGTGTFRIGEAIIHSPGDVNNLANGETVLVRLARSSNAAGQWIASTLKKETPLALVESIISSTTGIRADLEGYITKMESATRFVVAGVLVDASAARMPAGLAVGTLVDVEGVLSNGVLRADEVEREDDLRSDGSAFEIEGFITHLDTAKKTFEIRGVTIDYSNSLFEDGKVNNLRVGVKVEVDGVLSSDGKTIRAQVIEFDD